MRSAHFRDVNAARSGKSLQTFQDNLSAQSSRVKQTVLTLPNETV